MTQSLSISIHLVSHSISASEVVTVTVVWRQPSPQSQFQSLSPLSDVWFSISNGSVLSQDRSSTRPSTFCARANAESSFDFITVNPNSEIKKRARV
ncbi:hypothetical protein K474DRAFT_1659033, partial [Panus rudis PR-1116 ss-1]